jgi:hypothetical protein
LPRPRFPPLVDGDHGVAIGLQDDQAVAVSILGQLARIVLTPGLAAWMRGGAEPRWDERPRVTAEQVSYAIKGMVSIIAASNKAATTTNTEDVAAA